MHTRSAGTVAAIIALVLVVGACGGADIADQAAAGPATSSTATAANPANPVGVIAIGHSGLTGEGSDPSRPGQVALENSWATGTSLRSTVSTGGSSPSVRKPMAMLPTPPKAVRCLHAVCAGAARPGNRPHSGTRRGPDDRQRHRLRRDRWRPCARVRGRPRRRLELVTTASPDGRILVVGQLGRPSPSFVKKLVAEDPAVKPELTGPGMCDFFGPDGVLSKKAFDTGPPSSRTTRPSRPECAPWCSTCGTDDGARAAYVDRLENFSSDWNHLNVRGEAEVAEITWPAAAALLELT